MVSEALEWPWSSYRATIRRAKRSGIGTGMKPFNAARSVDEHWKIIRYMQTLR